ncbi:hypothetical protein [Caballeronia choica]|nr:hypothetical protein [Caballeronia choica]
MSEPQSGPQGSTIAAVSAKNGPDRQEEPRAAATSNAQPGELN